jgi:hypothetical protein
MKHSFNFISSGLVVNWFIRERLLDLLSPFRLILRSG